MDTHRTFPVESRRPHISHESFLFMRSEIERLTRALAIAEASADHWYMKANYTDEERAEMYRRASLGLDENGAWQWPDNLRTTASGREIEPPSGTRS